MLVTLKKAASEFKISLNHVKNLIRDGRWPHYKISRRVYRVDIDEIKKLSRINAEGAENVER